MELAQDPVQWQTLVLAVLNLQVLLPDLVKYQENMLRGWEVDGTGSGSCPVAGCGISGVEPSGSALNVREVC
jgi:hypothetical protein